MYLEIEKHFGDKNIYKFISQTSVTLGPGVVVRGLDSLSWTNSCAGELNLGCLPLYPVFVV